MPDIVSLALTSSERMSAAEFDVFFERLPPPEQLRANALRAETSRYNFVLGRLLLRAVVGRVAGVRPADVDIEVESGGRPVLVGSLRGLFVSIAHSGCYVLVGLATRPMGVDVEQVQPSAWYPRIAARVCSPSEIHQLEEVSEAARDRAFLTVWARKEAYGKALGQGLDFPLRSVTVGYRGSRIAGAAGRWRVCDVDVDPAYVAAAAAQGRGWRPHLDRIDRGSL